jgi:geranylgeranyl diphosphate synthase, type II
MKQFDTYMQAASARIAASVAERKAAGSRLAEPLAYALSSGGKLIRGCFTLAACDIYAGCYKPAIDLAAAIEIFHNFTLVHDDIMDAADIRRGMPAVHSKWGSSAAILTGDAMMVMANQLIANAPQHLYRAIFDEFNKAALEVCEGQQLDMEMEKTALLPGCVSQNEYINMISLKTSVLLASALKIGAAAADASPEQQNIIYSAGLALGLGFQLQDDLLDSFGEQESFGKKIGGDIIAKKKTFLVASLMDNSDKEHIDMLCQLFGQNNMQEAEFIGKVKELFVISGAKARAEEQISAYYAQSQKLLRLVEPQNTEALETLKAIFKNVSERKV